MNAFEKGPAPRPETGWTWLSKRLTLAVLLAIVAMAGFTAVAHEVHEGGTIRLDQTVLHFFQTHSSAPLRALFVGVSLLANGAVLWSIAALCLLVFWRKPGWRPEALSLLAAVIGGEALIVGLKALFHRARPTEVFTEQLGYSFPSGHAFFAVTVYGMLALWLARERPDRRHIVWTAAAVLIFFIGFSRIYLGVHFLSDVAAGFLVALPWLWGCLALPGVFGLVRQKEQKT